MLETESMTNDKLLVSSLWRGVARLEPVTHEVAVGGILFHVDVDDNGVHVSDDLAEALARHLKKRRVFT